MRRLRLAEWAILLGAVVLALSLGRQWFSVNVSLLNRPVAALLPFELATSGWDALGWFLVAMLVLCILLALALVISFVLGSGDATTLVFGAALGGFALPTMIGLLVVLASRPGLGDNLPANAVRIEPAGWIGAIAMVLLTAGSLASIRNERTAGRDRAYQPPPPRPAPSAAVAQPTSSDAS